MANVVYTERRESKFLHKIRAILLASVVVRPSLFAKLQLAARLFVGDLLQIAKLGRRDVVLIRPFECTPHTNYLASLSSTLSLLSLTSFFTHSEGFRPMDD